MNLEEFIKSRLESVDDLRALLLLFADPEKEWDAMSVAGKPYLPPARTAAVLARLAARRFFVADGQPFGCRFKAQSPEAQRLIGELAELDRQQPVTLIKMIYARPEAIRVFADAFRIKKKDN